jgi:hypothetical protein
MAEIRKERGAHLGLGFWRCSGEAADQVRAPVRLRRSLDDGDATTKIGKARRSRKHGRRSRSRPTEGEEGGWRGAGAMKLRGDGEELD